MRKLAGMFRPTQCAEQRFRGLDCLRRLGWAGVLVVVAIGSVLSCSGMPSLEEQERHVRDNQLVLHRLTPRAFVGAWGAPTYQHAEFMQFFGMKDDSLMPRSSVPSGEPPRGWEGLIEAGEALSLAYPDHGWLVVFFEERLVYHEALTAGNFMSWTQLATRRKFRSGLKCRPLHNVMHLLGLP